MNSSLIWKYFSHMKFLETYSFDLFPQGKTHEVVNKDPPSHWVCILEAYCERVATYPQIFLTRQDNKNH